MAVTKKCGKKIEDVTKLTDDQLDDISGGYLYVYDATPEWLADYYDIYKYEVIDDNTGTVLAEFYDEDLAIQYAQDMNLKTEYLSYEEKKELQRTGKVSNRHS